MVFAGVPFLFYFLPILLGAYYAVPKNRRRGRNLVLLCASLLFYAWGEGAYLLLLLVSILFNHVTVHQLAKATRRQRWLVAGVAGNLLLLGWFKYAGFLAQQIGLESFPAPHLPLGISFFSFQAISYLIDVYRKDAEPAGRLEESALYIASFPQLIAGPIVRFQEIAEAIRERTETIARFADGVRLFLFGLGQKVLLANLCAEPVDRIFALPPDQLSTGLAWIGVLGYSLQIFFDFAGYSNMAMGLGLMVGFQFPRNFNFPYMAQSVTEFWRRWHMTLSRWFRDYLYIPLGGNRKNRLRTILNLWIVFLLCGFWHGAAWTFVLWGAWHGLFLSFERLGFGKVLSRLPKIVGQSYLLLCVGLSWVLFRSEDLAYAAGYYATLLGVHSGDTPITAFIDGGLGPWIALATLFATPAPKAAMTWLGQKVPAPFWTGLSLVGFFLLFLLCAAFIAGGAYNPFIYFRF